MGLPTPPRHLPQPCFTPGPVAAASSPKPAPCGCAENRCPLVGDVIEVKPEVKMGWGCWGSRAVKASWPESGRWDCSGCHLGCPKTGVRQPGALCKPDFPVLRNGETLRGCWSLEMAL